MYRILSLALALILATGPPLQGFAQHSGDEKTALPSASTPTQHPGDEKTAMPSTSTPAQHPGHEQTATPSASTPAQDFGGEQTRPILRLENLIQEVHANNPSLRAARLGAEALTNRREQVTALPDPTVMAGYRPLDFDAASDAVPNLRVQQALPFPGKLALRGEAADFAAQAEGWRADALAEELILQVKLTYYQLYHLQQHDHHLQHFQESLEIFEASAAVKYEVGRGTQQAILKAQLEKNALA